jgi:hypothetical protein
MEQRTLRLGDIVDDYCPRERRITNHAVVAIVEDAIRQTRCTTCEHEHEYKHAREPRRRKKAVAALYEQVLSDVTNGQAGAARAVPAAAAEAGLDVAANGSAPAPKPVRAAVQDAPAPAKIEPPSEQPEPIAAADTPSEQDEPETRNDADLWPAHRTLIRATLPKLPAEVPTGRPIPEFTMHQRAQNGRYNRNARLMYGPQGDPFGRPLPPAQQQRQRSGEPNGNVASTPGKHRRRRRGKRRSSTPQA